MTNSSQSVTGTTRRSVPLRLVNLPDGDGAIDKPSEKVVQAVNGLHRCRRVVDGGRQSLLGDIHQLAEAECRVLVHA